MNTILQKLEKLNKTMEDGLARVEQIKTSSKPKSSKPKSKNVFKVVATALLVAPLAWTGLVLGALALYGLAHSIAWGMDICLKFLGF